MESLGDGQSEGEPIAHGDTHLNSTALPVQSELFGQPGIPNHGPVELGVQSILKAVGESRTEQIGGRDRFQRREA